MKALAVLVPVLLPGCALLSPASDFEASYTPPGAEEPALVVRWHSTKDIEAPSFKATRDENGNLQSVEWSAAGSSSSSAQDANRVLFEAMLGVLAEAAVRSAKP